MTTRTPIIEMDDAFKIIGHTQSASNNITIMKYRSSEYGSPDGIKRQFKLTQNNLKGFKEILGDPEFSYQNEYREFVWIHTFEDLTIVILSGEHGTSYEIRTEQSFNEFRSDDKTGEAVIRFLRGIVETLPDHAFRK